MPRTRKPKPTDVAEDVLDHFAGPARPMSPADVDAVMRRFKKALVVRMLGGELTHHLGYPPGGTKPADSTNQRNGTSGKTVLTDEGPIDLDVPRDRDGTFEPQLIPKHARRFTGFDEKILALYARGMTVREIQAFLAEMHAVEVSPDLISTVTDAVMEEVTAWQTRPLEPMYPVVFFDALRVKIRDEATVRSKAIYLALAVLPEYGAPSAEAASAALDAFERGPWGQKFPTVVAAWRRAWTHVIPFFAFPPEVRRVVYTTNALESMHAQLRKIIKTRGHFPNDEAATKLIWLALRNITAKWARGAIHWRAAMNQFAILYEGRFTKPAV